MRRPLRTQIEPPKRSIPPNTSDHKNQCISWNELPHSYRSEELLLNLDHEKTRGLLKLAMPWILVGSLRRGGTPKSIWVCPGSV